MNFFWRALEQKKGNSEMVDKSDAQHKFYKKLLRIIQEMPVDQVSLFQNSISSGNFFIGQVNPKTRTIDGKGIMVIKSRNQKYFGTFTKNQMLEFKGRVYSSEKIVNNSNSIQCVFDGSLVKNLDTGVQEGKGAIYENDSTSFKSLQTLQKIYQGTITDRTINGIGKLNLKQGQFQGVFKNGQLQVGSYKKFDDNKIYQVQIDLSKNLQEGKIERLNPYYLYKGPLKKQKPEGQGTQQTNDYKYVGHFAKGLKDGYGQIEHKNKNKFKGKWENDKQQIGYGQIFNQQGQYKGQIKGDLFHGKGQLKNEKYVFNGSFINGKKQGFGKVICRDGNQFQGQWKQNSQNIGTGKIPICRLKLDQESNSFQGQYQGQIKGYQPHGIGTFKAPKQWTYSGHFIEGLKHGHGKLIFQNKDQFQGQWNNDNQLAGKGIALNGKYRGQMFNKLPHGTGKLVQKEYMYEGQFVKGEKCGNGFIKYIKGAQSGSCIKGSWKDDKFEKGEGTYISDIGAYDGQLSGMLKNGYGTLILLNGDKLVGTWKNNFLQGQGVMTQKSGKRYEGNFIKTQRSGKGHYFNLNGETIYSGYFQQDDYHGQGKLYHEQYQYMGQFDKGKKHGFGVFDSKMYHYEGQWVNDLYHGQGQLTYKDEQQQMYGIYQNGLENGQFSVTSLIDGKIIFVGQYRKGLRQGQGTGMDGPINLLGVWSKGKKNGVFIQNSFINGTLQTKKVIYDMDEIVDEMLNSKVKVDK